MYSSNSTQQPAAICALKSPADAIHILEAVRLGLVPRVTRRLTGQERSMIRPGTIWVWEEEETNMRRWTDGRRWGASRVGGGGFLVYTESTDGLSPPPSNPNSPSYQQTQFWPSGAKKSESLVKQTYSTSMTHPVTGKLKKFHVVAYSSKHNPQGDAHNPLPLPHQLPLLATLKITPGIWPEWEHRREADYARRQVPQLAHSHHHNQPHPSHHGSVPPPSMTPSAPDYTQRPPSPGQYGARPQESPLPMPRYDQSPYASPYYAPQPRDAYQQYQSRPVQHAATPTDRFHPYNDASRSRPSPQAAYPNAAGASSSNILPPTPSSAQGEYYEQHRNPGNSPPAVPFHQPYRTNAYTYADDLSARPYDHRGQYQIDPAAAQWDPKHHIDQSQSQPQQTPQQPLNLPLNQQQQQVEPRRVPSTNHIRNTSNPSHLIPPTEQANPNASGKSPKMSIGSALLNPHSDKAAQGGLTLPPLRLEGGEQAKNGNSGSESGSEGARGEGTRQLGELSKSVAL